MDGLDNAVLKSANIVNYSSIQNEHISKCSILIIYMADFLSYCDIFTVRPKKKKFAGFGLKHCVVLRNFPEIWLLY